jgi:hypothetical protein
LKCRFAGALTVANSSMSTIGSFAHLVSIATNGQRAAVNGARYEVVVSGLLMFISNYSRNHLLLHLQATMRF